MYELFFTDLVKQKLAHSFVFNNYIVQEHEMYETSFFVNFVY